VPAHDANGRLMVPGGQFMAENDTSWKSARTAGIFLLSPQSSALITYLLTLNL
jgi:hypothetical protein